MRTTETESVTSPAIPPPQEQDSKPQPPQDSDAAARERADTIQRRTAEIRDWLMASLAEEEKNVERRRRERGLFMAKRNASTCILRLLEERRVKEGNINAYTDDDMKNKKRKRADVEVTSDEVISSGDSVPKKKSS